MKPLVQSAAFGVVLTTLLIGLVLQSLINLTLIETHADAAASN
jgi:NhaP-type Na+/H+ and K+/H+ antiporter